MVVLKVRARGDGRIVNWSGLKQGRLVDVSRLTGMTMTLTDVVSDLCSFAESLDREYRVETLVPNGPGVTSYDLVLIGIGFSIVCSLRVVRGWYPLNPFAAEWGVNYDVIVTAHAESSETETHVVAMLTSKYMHQRVV